MGKHLHVYEIKSMAEITIEAKHDDTRDKAYETIYEAAADGLLRFGEPDYLFIVMDPDYGNCKAFLYNRHGWEKSIMGVGE